MPFYFPEGKPPRLKQLLIYWLITFSWFFCLCQNCHKINASGACRLYLFVQKRVTLLCENACTLTIKFLGLCEMSQLVTKNDGMGKIGGGMNNY